MATTVFSNPFQYYEKPTVPSMGSPDTMYGYANNAISSAYNYIAQLGLVTQGLTPPTITPVFPAGGSAPALQVTQAPAFTPINPLTFTIPTQLVADVNIDQYLPAPFDAAPPALVYGLPPAAVTETAPASPGVDFTYALPTLSVTLPAAPQMLSLDVQKFAGFNLPAIDSTVPVLTALAPSTVNYTPGDGYTSALMTQLKSTLLNRIANGGTGLKPEIEQAIWNRAREREAIASDDALRELERMEELGYAFPPGVYNDTRTRINTEMRARTVSLSREIAIEQAKLELENVNKSLELAVGLESQIMTYTNQVEQRLFESSKYATEAGIAIYNAKVQAYAAYLDAYKTKVAIYDAQVRAELGRVEAYKAEVQAEQAKAQINVAMVDQYKAQIEAALSNVEVFKAEVGAIQAKASIEKMKIEAFGEQVKAYTSKITAYTAGVEGFRAMIQAEATKQEAYKSQVEAYKARVQAGVSAAEAKIEEYKGRITAKTAEWEGYKSAVQGEAAKAQAIAASNSSLADRYKAEVSGISAYNETLTKQWQVALDQAQRVSEIGVSAAKANAELYMTTRSLALDAAKVGSQVSAQLGAAALNAINYSYSVSSSNNMSGTVGNSLNQAISLSETHAYSNSDITQKVYNYSA